MKNNKFKFIEDLLHNISKTNKNRNMFFKELDYIIRYLKNKNYKYYIEEILEEKYLAIKKGNNICYIRLNEDSIYLTKYEIIIFRYSFNLNRIEHFRIKEIVILDDKKDIERLINIIEERVTDISYFDFIINNYKTKEKSDYIKLEEYNKLLKENEFKTAITDKVILSNVSEILFFTKNKENLINPNTIFALWINEDNKIIVSNIIYFDSKINSGSFYDFEEIEKFSIYELRRILI